MTMQGKNRGGMQPNSSAIRALHGLAGAAAVLWVNAGCTVGPDYAEPEAAVETQWINQSDPRVSPREAKLADWWKVFKDPDLVRLVDEARRQNLTLQLAGGPHPGSAGATGYRHRLRISSTSTTERRFKLSANQRPCAEHQFADRPQFRHCRHWL